MIDFRCSGKPFPELHDELVIARKQVPSAPGVNFTNVLPAAFTPADPKSAIKLLKLTVFFALLGSAFVKAAHRMLVKLTPGEVEGVGHQGHAVVKVTLRLNVFQGKTCRQVVCCND